MEESQSAVVSYLEGGPSLEVRRIAAWNRGDIEAPVMSASSGPKDYFKNEIYALFQSDPELQRIVLVRARAGRRSYCSKGRMGGSTAQRSRWC